MDLTTINPGFIIAALISFFIAVVIGPLFIPFLKGLKFGQAIRAEGPQSHQKKSGTPTMGGVIFLLSTLLTTVIGLIFWEDFEPTSTLMMLLLSLLGFGLIGFIDDFIIVVKKDNEGLRPTHKILGQFLLAAVFFYLFMTAGYSTVLNFGFGQADITWGYGIFVLIWLIGWPNATNITDGLDGLLSGISIIAFGVFGVIAIAQGQTEIMLFCFTMVGALAGFLVFNLNPAKVFMGDTGSLAIGASLAAVSILLRQEWLILLVGFVYAIETLSVILQVLYFKATGGKRIFKMAPLHHHFEESGWSERKVVTLFWAIALITGITALHLIVL